MDSKPRKISRSTPPSSPFGRWMDICLTPIALQLEALDLSGTSTLRSPNANVHLCHFSLMLLTLAEALALCGAGLAVWCVLKGIAIAVRKTQRPKYYPAEKLRRQALAAERRRIRRRITVNAAPTAEELIAQYARIKRNPKEMIRFGSMLCDLEAYVDNSLRHDENGVIVGRNPGIRGWLAGNCGELAAHYKTVMRYKAMAEQFRQVVGLRDPLPAALALAGEANEETGDASGNTVRKSSEISGNEESAENENMVRKISLEEKVIVGKARKMAEEFFGKCGMSMRGAYAELENRLGPGNVPPEMVAAERIRQGLSPKPGLRERFVAAVLA